MKLNIKGTRLLQETLQSNSRFVVHIGGTRSSKSYSIAQRIVIYILQNQNKVVSVCRKTLPALKSTAFRDFKEVMTTAGIWNDDNLNKSELTYTHNNNTIEFFSVDQSQKIRGRKRDVLWINEANEINNEDFLQLSVRTEGQIFLDFNPSEVDNWIHDLISARPAEATVIHSTYLDAMAFLPPELVREIEANRETNPEWFEVFGMGNKPSQRDLVYASWKPIDKIPSGLHTAIGVDFGYVHPTAAIRVHFGDGVIYLEQILYESYLTSLQIAERIKSLVSEDEEIWCDAAEPDKIAELKGLGLRAKGADKSVKAGIDSVKFNKIFIHKDSVNIMKEMKSYRWKKNAKGNALDEPVKMNDDAMDAFRYCVFNERKNVRNGGGSFDFIVETYD